MQRGALNTRVRVEGRSPPPGQCGGSGAPGACCRTLIRRDAVGAARAHDAVRTAAALALAPPAIGVVGPLGLSPALLPPAAALRLALALALALAALAGGGEGDLHPVAEAQQRLAVAHLPGVTVLLDGEAKGLERLVHAVHRHRLHEAARVERDRPVADAHHLRLVQPHHGLAPLLHDLPVGAHRTRMRRLLHRPSALAAALAAALALALAAAAGGVGGGALPRLMPRPAAGVAHPGPTTRVGGALVPAVLGLVPILLAVVAPPRLIIDKV
eukprot:scaffold36529_cov62-Phaeocystis_antarctica.AAC.2